MTTEPSMQGPPRLELRGVVLSDNVPIDQVVASGVVVAVSGWNNSELLWAIAGLGPVTSGEILIDGRRTVGHDQAVAAGVALISQGSALAGLLTALENVLLPLAGRHRTAGQRQPIVPDHDPAAVARQALAAVGLSDSANHLIEDLSGGQQQRVAVARAIAARPRLLLADQPTTDLDVGNRTRVLRLLRELAAAGSAVLLASDDPAIVAASDRTVVLEPVTNTGHPSRW